MSEKHAHNVFDNG